MKPVEIAFVHEIHGPCPFCRGYELHNDGCKNKDWTIDQIMDWWMANGLPSRDLYHSYPMAFPGDDEDAETVAQALRCKQKSCA